MNSTSSCFEFTIREWNSWTSGSDPLWSIDEFLQCNLFAILTLKCKSNCIQLSQLKVFTKIKPLSNSLPDVQFTLDLTTRFNYLWSILNNSVKFCVDQIMMLKDEGRREHYIT